MRTIFFSSHDVSKPDSGSYLSEVRDLISIMLLTFIMVVSICLNDTNCHK